MSHNNIMQDNEVEQGSGSQAIPKRAWQRMLSGRRLDLLNPQACDVEIEDIAHGLARVARWNGQTVGDHAYSVAEHSLLVTDILLRLNPEAPVAWQMAALLHDAPEYVIGDLISPFKAAIGMDYKVFELKILDAIHERFAIADIVNEEVKAFVKQADGIAAFFEAVQLAGFDIEEARKFFAAPLSDDARFHSYELKLEALTVCGAQAAFLARFAQLQNGSD